MNDSDIPHECRCEVCKREMNPAPSNAVDPAQSKIIWCRMCHRKIHGMACWVGDLAFHEKCHPVPRADYERLSARVDALEKRSVEILKMAKHGDMVRETWVVT